MRFPKGVQVLWTELLFLVSVFKVLRNPARHTRKARMFVMRLMTADTSNASCFKLTIRGTSEQGLTAVFSRF